MTNLIKENLVVLKDGIGTFNTKTTEFKPHTFYHSKKISNQIMVFGVVFDLDKFNELFEFVQSVEMVMWESVRRDMKYPKSDNNNGYIYGLNLINDESEDEIMDVQWFKTNEERNNFIDENNLRVINEY